MKFIVFDTEFTSWEGSLKNNWNRENEHRELVQIAAYKLDNNKIIDSLDMYIKPNINCELSEYFVNLTGITNEKIKKDGINSIDALQKFYKFSEGIDLYSYGNDYEIIEENLLLNCITLNSKLFSSEWKKQFKDFKILINHLGIDLNQYTSGTIYKAFNIKVDNTAVHNAMWDAYSLFLVCQEIFK